MLQPQDIFIVAQKVKTVRIFKRSTYKPDFEIAHSVSVYEMK